jgi:hypothetical protein
MSPPNTEVLFGSNYFVIVLGSFRIAETFSHHCYKSLWMGLPSVILVVN